MDIGCGNGKYLSINPKIFMLGSDYSTGLVEIAASKGFEVLIGDALYLPHQEHRFDFAISIAVIHHFSTPERRIEAVRRILSMLNENGEALIYVWALEQENSRRGYKKGMDPDVFVPWVLQTKQKKRKSDKEEEIGEDKKEEKEKEEVKYRYYHLYEEGELEKDVVSAGGIVVSNGYEKDNWWVVIKRNLTIQ